MAYLPPNGGRMNVTIGGNSAGVASNVSTGTLGLMGGNNITLSQNGNNITISGGAGGAGIALANTQTTYSTGTAQLSVGGGAMTIASAAGQKYNFSVPNSSSLSVTGALSMSVNASTISLGVPAQTNQTVGFYASGANTIGQSSSSTLDARSVNISGQGGLSVGLSGSTLQMSAPNSSSLSATGIISLSPNGNTLSIGAPAFSAGISNIGNTNGTSGTASNQVIFAGGNNIMLSQATGAGGNTITISASNQSAQTQSNIQALVGGTVAATASTGTVTFANSNGVTFGMNANTMTASHNGITSQTNQSIGFSAGVNTSLTSTGTFDARSMRLNGLGAASIGFSNSSMFVSAPQTSSISATGAVSVSLNGSTISIGAPAFSAGISNIGNTSGTSGMQSNRLVLAGGNNITLSQSNDANGATVSISGGAGGAGGFALYDGANSITSGTARLTAGGALTASINGQTLSLNAPATSSLVGVNGITISTNGNTISISGGGGGGGATLSYYNPQDAYVQVTGQQGNGSLHIQPTPAPNVTFDRAVFPVLFTGATNSTGTITLSMMLGVYTRTGSTLSLSTSFSTSNAITHSGTANSSQNVGLKLYTMGASHSFSEGQYYMGIWSRTSSGGANATISQMLASQQNTNLGGLWGVSPNATNQYTRGLGVYTASTAAMPGSVGFSQINGTNSNVLRQPLFYVINGTV